MKNDIPQRIGSHLQSINPDRRQPCKPKTLSEPEKEAHRKRVELNVDVIDRAVGPLYADCKLANFICDGPEAASKEVAVEACLRYIKNFRSHERKGRGLLFMGPVGTGKDHLMIAVLRGLIRSYGYFAKYRFAYQMFDEHFATFNSSDNSIDVVGRYVRPDLLAISDILPGSRPLNTGEEDFFMKVVNQRYPMLKPILATVNASGRREIDSRLGASNADRLLERCDVVMCNWESYRQRPSAK